MDPDIPVAIDPRRPDSPGRDHEAWCRRWEEEEPVMTMTVPKRSEVDDPP